MAEKAIEAGADLINDVSGGTFDSNMIPLSQKTGIPMVYMHMRGNPQTMIKKEFTSYNNLIDDISNELKSQLTIATKLGIPRWTQIIDPGIGFAKTADSNMSLLYPSNLSKLRRHLDDRMIMIGLSRKRFIGSVLENSIHDIDSENLNKNKSDEYNNPENRDNGTIGACIASLLSTSGPDSNSLSSDELPVESSVILRVHNVKAVREAVDMFTQVRWPSHS